jgi:hypothetical protein
MNMLSDSAIHLAMFLGTVAAYTIMNLTGHGDPTNNQAMLALASFVGGSYARGLNPGGK